MKAIELTTDDISKLLEIINYLYKDDYLRITLNSKEATFYTTKDDYLRITLNSKEATFYTTDFEYSFINWYELIIEKIIPDLFKFNKEHIIMKFISSDTKIELLYNEFKSIKI